jgi:hypothetical protein
MTTNDKTTVTKKAPAKKAVKTIPTWTPKGDDAKHKCSGACGKTLPVKRFPTITGRPGVRGGECRSCRNTRTKAAKEGIAR